MKIQIIIIVFLTLLSFVTTNNINIEKKEIPFDNAQVFQRISKIKEKIIELSNSTKINDEENTREKIKKLKTIRDYIFKNITNGIDESVASLQKTNNYITLVKYLKELKDDIEKLNAAYTFSGLGNDTRRLSKLHNYMKHLTRDMQIRIKEDRKLVQEKASRMFKALTEESEKKRKEKKVLRTGGGRRRTVEKCPRYGYRNASQYSGDDDDDGKNTRRATKYPCCRKCCKRSYLGCL